MDLRRVTLVVDDIDNSLKFYRDALGMVVTYDNIIVDPKTATTLDEATKWRRLVFLRCNNSFVGVLGLLQYMKPAQRKSPKKEGVMQNGDCVLLFNCKDDARVRIAAAAAVPGSRLHDAPEEVEYPGYDGKSMIKVLRSVIIDPDGFAVECNQLLSELK